MAHRWTRRHRRLARAHALARTRKTTRALPAIGAAAYSRIYRRGNTRRTPRARNRLGGPDRHRSGWLVPSAGALAHSACGPAVRWDRGELHVSVLQRGAVRSGCGEATPAAGAAWFSCSESDSAKRTFAERAPGLTVARAPEPAAARDAREDRAGARREARPPAGSAARGRSVQVDIAVTVNGAPGAEAGSPSVIGGDDFAETITVPVRSSVVPGWMRCRSHEARGPCVAFAGPVPRIVTAKKSRWSGWRYRSAAPGTPGSSLVARLPGRSGR